MRVLVTGGAGYIGTALVDFLAKNDAIKQIIVYDNLSRKNFNLFLGEQVEQGHKIKLIQADILDSRKLNATCQNVDIVFHLAAKVTTPFADDSPHAFDQVNHWGSAELVQAVEKAGVDRVVFLSSASVYGSTTDEADETSKLDPSTFYGISKADAELHFERILGKSHCHIIRCGNVYGFNRSMRFDGVINRFVFNANFTNRLNINGDGNQVRSFVHIDHVSSVLGNLAFEEFPEGTYNLVENTASINEITQILKEFSPDLETIHVNQNVKLRELRVSPNDRLNSLASSSTKTFRQKIEEFSHSFSF